MANPPPRPPQHPLSSLPTVVEGNQGDVIFCPRCGRRNERDEIYCQVCTQPLRGLAPCPHCRANIPVNAAFCPRCGRSVC